MPFSAFNTFAGVGEGGGGGFDWASLLQNPFFLSLMSQVGAGLAGDNQAVQGVNAINQQAIGAKSKADMMQRLLAGQVPGGSLQITDKGIKIALPPSGESGLGSLSDNSGLALAQQGSQLKGGSGIQWNQQNMPSQVRQLNPFVSSQPGAFSYADLAGLTSQDVTEAFGANLQQQRINQESINSVYDNMYKIALMNQAQSVAESRKPIFTVPGTGVKLSANDYLEWKKLGQSERTSLVKEYEYAQEQGFKGSIIDFKNSVGSTGIKDYEYAKSQGYEGSYYDWKTDIAKAGAINLGEAVEKRKALGQVDQELKVTDPDYIPKIEAELKKDAYSWRKRVQPKTEAFKAKGMSDSEARRWAEKVEIADDIQLRLERQFGKDKLKVDLINDEFVWTVDGKVVQRYK